MNESITVNKMILDLNGIVGGDTGRKLSDLMSFKVFNSKFKGITYLEITFTEKSLSATYSTKSAR